MNSEVGGTPRDHPHFTDGEMQTLSGKVMYASSGRSQVLGLGWEPGWSAPEPNVFTRLLCCLSQLENVSERSFSLPKATQLGQSADFNHWVSGSKVRVALAVALKVLGKVKESGLQGRQQGAVGSVVT